MSSFIIEGGCPLHGEITPQGAKNEALQVISAVLLTSRPVEISNVPEIRDVRNLVTMLELMGVKVTRHEPGRYTFEASDINTDYIFSDEFIRHSASLRGSVLLAGPLLARLGKTYFPKPGGDKIGRRRLDTHFYGLQKLGARFFYDEDGGTYHIEAPKLKGTYMLLDEASITGTANIIMAIPP